MTGGAGGTLGNTQQSSAADLVRACTSRGVVLEDVIPAGNRVKLLGVAEERFKGRRVDIVFAATGKVVARPKVGADGSFSATAPMPPRRLRFSNRARYQARVGGERSLNLKLMRRMLVTSVRTSAGKVTIAGKVVGPLALRAKEREIVLERRVTCTRLATVSRFRPRANGAFKVTVPVPAGTSAAVYRLRTQGAGEHPRQPPVEHVHAPAGHRLPLSRLAPPWPRPSTPSPPRIRARRWRRRSS